jgi:hypothetical protein
MPAMRTPIVHLLLVSLLCLAGGSAGLAAPDSRDIAELVLKTARKGDYCPLCWRNFYPDKPPCPATLIVETKINGMYHKTELPLGLVKEIAADFEVTFDDPHTVHISAIGRRSSEHKKDVRFERRLRDPFGRGRGSAILYTMSIDLLRKVVPDAYGTPMALTFGPVGAGLSQREKERALRRYRESNYILFRFRCPSA